MIPFHLNLYPSFSFLLRCAYADCGRQRHLVYIRRVCILILDFVLLCGNSLAGMSVSHSLASNSQVPYHSRFVIYTVTCSFYIYNLGAFQNLRLGDRNHVLTIRIHPMREESVGHNNHNTRVLYHSVCLQSPYVLAESDGAISASVYETRHSVKDTQVSKCRLLSGDARAHRPRSSRCGEACRSIYLHQPVEMGIKGLRGGRPHRSLLRHKRPRSLDKEELNSTSHPLT